jgi:hypothetical protein
MSRTRQNPNEIPLYLYKMSTTDTGGHIENSWNDIPIKFNGEDMGTKTKAERDILTGRVLQGTTVQIYRTTNQVDMEIGDNISEKANATNLEQSTIINIRSKPQNKRGARLNTQRVYEYTIEVS